MIHSMTGYAMVTRELPQGSLNLELRSVNNRYLDIQFRLPDEFRSLEAAMREFLTSRLNRGKVECRLNFSRLPGKRRYPGHQFKSVSEAVGAGPYDQGCPTRSKGIGSGGYSALARNPGWHFADDGEFAGALYRLAPVWPGRACGCQIPRGSKLKAVLLERIHTMRSLINEVAPRIPALLTAFQEKLKARLHEALINCDDERIRLELGLFASKIDVDEELSRLRAHLEEVERILSRGGATGKRLDFLMQELNREANTLAAKSVDTEVSKISVELKVLIEQMREQVQNIE